MAGRKNIPTSLHIHSNAASDSDDGHQSETPNSAGNRPNGGGNRPNGRVYSPDYMSPPCYQPVPPVQGSQSQYQQPFNTRPGIDMNDERIDGSDHINPSYYVQDQINNRTIGDTKQIPEEYRGMILSGDPPPYRTGSKAPPIRDNRYPAEYSSEPPGHLALPPSDYRQPYFTQGLNGGNEVNRRFSPLRLPLMGTQWRLCSWRFCALAFLTISLALTATTIYLAAFQISVWDTGNQCDHTSNGVLIPNSPSSHRLPAQQRPATRDAEFMRSDSSILYSSISLEGISDHAKTERIVTVTVTQTIITSYPHPLDIYEQIMDNNIKTHDVKESKKNHTLIRKPKQNAVDFFDLNKKEVLIPLEKSFTRQIEKPHSHHVNVQPKPTIFQDLGNIRDIGSRRNKETSKHVLVKPRNFMKNLLSQPASKLHRRTSSNILRGNLHISEDRQNALRNINLYANDIANLKMKNTNSTSRVQSPDDNSTLASRNEINKAQKTRDVSGSLYTKKVRANYARKKLNFNQPIQVTKKNQAKKVIQPKVQENFQNEVILLPIPNNLNEINLNEIHEKISLPLNLFNSNVPQRNHFSKRTNQRLALDSNGSGIVMEIALNLNRSNEQQNRKNKTRKNASSSQRKLAITSTDKILTKNSLFNGQNMRGSDETRNEFQISYPTDHQSYMALDKNLDFNDIPKLNSTTVENNDSVSIEKQNNVSEIVRASAFSPLNRNDSKKLSDTSVRPKSHNLSIRQHHLQKESNFFSRMKVDTMGMLKVSNLIRIKDTLSIPQKKFKDHQNRSEMQRTPSDYFNPSFEKPMKANEGPDQINLKSNLDSIDAFSLSSRLKEEDHLGRKFDKFKLHNKIYFKNVTNVASDPIRQKDKLDIPSHSNDQIKNHTSEESAIYRVKRETEKQQNNSLSRKNQYPPINDDAGVVATPPFVRIPTEGSKNKELSNEYSNSALRISAPDSDIESAVFFNAIYPARAALVIDTEQSFADPDHDVAASTLAGFMSLEEPFYQTQSAATQEIENLVSLQSSLRMETDIQFTDKTSVSKMTQVHLESLASSPHGILSSFISSTNATGLFIPILNDKAFTKNYSIQHNNNNQTEIWNKPISIIINENDQSIGDKKSEIDDEIPKKKLSSQLHKKLIDNESTDISRSSYSQSISHSELPMENKKDQITVDDLFVTTDSNLYPLTTNLGNSFEEGIYLQNDSKMEKKNDTLTNDEKELEQKSNKKIHKNTHSTDRSAFVTCKTHSWQKKIFTENPTTESSSSDKSTDKDPIEKNGMQSLALSKIFASTTSLSLLESEDDFEIKETELIYDKSALNNVELYPSANSTSGLRIENKNKTYSKLHQDKNTSLHSMQIIQNQQASINLMDQIETPIIDANPDNLFTNGSLLETNLRTENSHNETIYDTFIQNQTAEEDISMDHNQINVTAVAGSNNEAPYNETTDRTLANESYLENTDEGIKVIDILPTLLHQVDDGNEENKSDTKMDQESNDNYVSHLSESSDNKSHVAFLLKTEKNLFNSKRNPSNFKTGNKESENSNEVKVGLNRETNTFVTSATAVSMDHEISRRRNDANKTALLDTLSDVSASFDQHSEGEHEQVSRESNKDWKRVTFRIENPTHDLLRENNGPIFAQENEQERPYNKHHIVDASHEVNFTLNSLNISQNNNFIEPRISESFDLSYENYNSITNTKSTLRIDSMNKTFDGMNNDTNEAIGFSAGVYDETNENPNLENILTNKSQNLQIEDLNEQMPFNKTINDLNKSSGNETFMTSPKSNLITKSSKTSLKQSYDMQFLPNQMHPIENDKSKGSNISSDSTGIKLSPSHSNETNGERDISQNKNDANEADGLYISPANTLCSCSCLNANEQQDFAFQSQILKDKQKNLNHSSDNSDNVAVVHSVSPESLGNKTLMLVEETTLVINNISNDEKKTKCRLEKHKLKKRRHHHGTRIRGGKNADKLLTNSSKNLPPILIANASSSCADEDDHSSLNTGEKSPAPKSNSKSNRKKKSEFREMLNCSLGKKECSARMIASLYLNLFGTDNSGSRSDSFKVVPILFGKEINNTSFHWRNNSNNDVHDQVKDTASIINSVTDPRNSTILSSHNSTDSLTNFAEFRSTNDGVEEPMNATGSTTSSVRRPHQIAPPDGASFSALILGESLTTLMTPYGYWNLHLTLSDTTEMHLALKIPRGTSLGLYARRNALPTHTQHDLMKILRGTKPRETRSSSGGAVEVTIEEVFESGDWFLSFYNDDGEPHQVGLMASRGSGSGECPQRCNGRGHCFLGRCQCQTGYGGHDCSEVLCPILCNGRGEYVEGKCQCHPGWKGKECELKYHECEVPDCSGHGHCVDGLCHCANGFTGDFCEKVDCPNPTCSGHGWCVRGTCVCDRGWKRPDCSQMDTEALQCLPDCSKHGTFDINTHSCICDPPWTGSDCSKEACSLDCGPHGKCENEICQCDDGWTGRRCFDRLCDTRCMEHGQCKNGTCACMTGWNGRHCTLSGCPSNCMYPSNGHCRADNFGQWSCKCNKEWEGADCSVLIEMNCNDGIDNDDDGLTDCQDPECCEKDVCNKSTQCGSSSSPIDILLMMQPPAETASFYEKMQFIIQDNSLQIYQNRSFNKRRAAVIRGRVVTAAGRPIVRLRVSTLNQSDGVTWSRLDGMFDIMVNGGGAVTLTFGKSSFTPREVQVVVPWNEIVVLDDIVMTIGSTVHQRSGYRGHIDYMNRANYNETGVGSVGTCAYHDFDVLRPVIMSTWQNEFQGECPDGDAILVETQAVQESVQIPGTGLYLVYHSSRATGYKSTIRFQLTPEEIPISLRRVHLRIVLEGILFKKVFEADPLIKFTYSWDRNNVYKVKVYGTTIARISVGYEHTGCNMIIWDHHTTKVAGYDFAISEMGGFNLHVHHAYNFHQGILQKGDGRNIHLGGQRHLVTTLLGTGNQRDVACGPECDGDAIRSSLLAPTCLAAAPDGSLYVGDFDLIRRVTPEGKVYTVAKLNETRVSYRYHIAVSPVTGEVYVSDPDAHQVLKLKKTFDVENISHNVIAVVGSGERCLPGDPKKCGDGGHPLRASLTYPKGLAISPYNDIYIADGTNIRVMSGNVIRTVIGGHDHRSHWAPVPCNGTIERDQLRLRWPTELAISPLDGSLHILDDHLVLRLTPDNRVQVLTGRPLHCPAPSHNPQHMSRAALLQAPQSIAFSLQGDLYIAESDTIHINRVRVIKTNGQISTFVGVDSKCNCRQRSCFCHTFDNVSASAAVFSLIPAIAVTPDGILHISDQASYRVRSVRSLLPEQNSNGEYEIYSPDTHEVFVFNRFGKHMETQNLVTGQTIYKFTYNTDVNTGKLSSVTDAASNSFKVIRRTYAKKTFIENPQKQRVTIHFTIMNNDLEKLEAPDGYNITFRYHGASELIQSKMEGGGRTYSYEYDDHGRLLRAVLPTGEVMGLNFDLSSRGAEVTATRDGEHSVTAIIRGDTITHKTDSIQAISEPRGEGGLRLVTAWEHEISLERTSYKVLESISPISAQMFPVLSRQQTRIGKDRVNLYNWNYSPAERIHNHQGMKVSSSLRVNNEDLLTLEYDPVSSSEALLSVSGEELVNITYDSIGRPTRWLPLEPLVPTSVSYDAWGHVTLWKRGRLSEGYEYDHLLRLASVTYGDNTTIRYEFTDKLTKPERVTYPSGRSYGLTYDEAGALREVVTPKGSIYSLHLSTSLGFYRLRLALPGNTVVMQMRIDEQGRLEAIAHPDEEGILLYEYDLLGRLRNELYGHGYTEYSYMSSGLLKTARARHSNHDIRVEFKYRTGLAKEMKIKYGPKSNLENAKFHYQYDESARLRVLDGEISGNAVPEIYLKYDNLTGSLLAVNDLRIIRNNILETKIVNQKKYYVSTRKLDNYGRLSEEVIRLQDKTVYMMQLKYDLRGRISEQINEISGRRLFTNYKYMADGHILEATGGHTRLYTYDKNGNVLSFTKEARSEFLHYDECDRVYKAGDGDVQYDSKGYVISYDSQNFEYNTKGHLIAGYARDKSWSFTLRYDHFSRVSIYRDHWGNVTQLIYARPDKPLLISHLHNPKTHQTSTLIYDDQDRLIAMDSPNGRIYIATDQNGAPVAFFDDNGGFIRRQQWTPFGRISESAGTPLWVGIGPWGGLVEPITEIVIINGYAYHPHLLQWMTPRWDKLTRATRQVTDVFVYRFRNNDPVNPPDQLDYHFNDVGDWLEVMGIKLDRVLGSEYQSYMLDRPKPSIDVSALVDSEVVSGLWCQYRACINNLKDLSFFSKSHIQRHVGAWKGAPISRQSYVFGPGVLISSVNGRVLVTYVPKVKDGSSVIGNVIRSVLNNSLILDVSSTRNGRDTFYFIKDEEKRAIEDKETLARLSGIYNVTHKEVNGNIENHVAIPTADIIIFYNKKIDRIRNRILAELEIYAEKSAWKQEARLVTSGRAGTRAWSPAEIQDLETKGHVPGYVARHVHPSNKYPLLAADPSNILFKHESPRKRRKSRRKERKKAWKRRNRIKHLKNFVDLDT